MQDVFTLIDKLISQFRGWNSGTGIPDLSRGPIWVIWLAKVTIVLTIVILSIINQLFF